MSGRHAANSSKKPLIIVICAVVLVALIAGAVILFMNFSGKNDNSATTVPTSAISTTAVNTDSTQNISGSASEPTQPAAESGVTSQEPTEQGFTSESSDNDSEIVVPTISGEEQKPKFSATLVPYYAKDENGISKKWMQYMKNSIMSTGGKYSTARMVVDYTNQLYIPLCNLTKKYYTNLESVTEYSVWKKDITTNWKDVQIEQIEGNADNITLDAGNQIEVKCVVTLPNIDVRHIEAQVYYGKFLDDGSVQDVKIIPMKLDGKDDENKKYYYSAKIDLISGGNYGYSFRVMPKHEMLLESANLDLIKWVEK